MQQQQQQQLGYCELGNRNMGTAVFLRLDESNGDENNEFFIEGLVVDNQEDEQDSLKRRKGKAKQHDGDELRQFPLEASTSEAAVRQSIEGNIEVNGGDMQPEETRISDSSEIRELKRKRLASEEQEKIQEISGDTNDAADKDCGESDVAPGFEGKNIQKEACVVGSAVGNVDGGVRDDKDSGSGSNSRKVCGGEVAQMSLSGGVSACFKCGVGGHKFRDCPKEACYKCGEEGHKAWDCPKRGGSACFRCGGEGHISRDCPTRNRACFLCGKEGHFSRDCGNAGGCSETSKDTGSAAATNRFRGCYKCGEDGHISRECRSGGGGGRVGSGGGGGGSVVVAGGGGGGGGGGGCYKCGEDGHISRDCRSGGGPGRGGGGSVGSVVVGGGGGGGGGCYACGMEGHLSRDCPRRMNVVRVKACYKCGGEGHISRDCTTRNIGVAIWRPQ